MLEVGKIENYITYFFTSLSITFFYRKLNYYIKMRIKSRTL